MSKVTLTVDGREYQLSAEQQRMYKEAGDAFDAECEEVNRIEGIDGHFHGFNNAWNPYAEAERRYQQRVRAIVGATT